MSEQTNSKIANSDILKVELSAEPALVIRDVVKTFKLGKVMSYAYKKIFDHIILKTGECKAHNIPFCIYNQLDWSEMNKTGLFATFKLLFLKDWHLEIGIPTESSVPAFEDMIQTELPAGRFLKTMHIGPYMKVGAAYNRILEYANTNTLELGDFSIERYLNDPKNVAQQELQTEVLVPIKG